MDYPHQDCHPSPPPPAPPVRLPNQTLAEHHYELLDWSAKFLYWQATRSQVGNAAEVGGANVMQALNRIETKLDRVLAK
jgi:hypothetical protein